MKRNIPKSKKQPARKAWLSGIMSFSLAFCFAMNSHSLEAQELRISAIEADDNGLIKILVEGPAGDYVLESTNDLRSEINWGDLFRKGLPGAQTEITDPFSQTSLGKFYRVTVFPAADGFHINGEFAQELEGGVSFTDLQTAFGLTFPDTDAVIPPVSNLSGAARNARVYAATIASLSKIAQTIRDSFELGSQPSTAEIIAALAADLASGELDGRNSANELIQIGTTGTNLLEFTQEDFLDNLDLVRVDLAGLHNVVFSSETEGKFSTAVPADWSDFCWGSADWQ